MNGNIWKLLGVAAAVLASAAFLSMYPDLKRYMKIERM